MVQTAPARCCERAAENPERQAPRPLPVLRTTNELPRYSAVLPESPLHLAGMAEPPDTWKAADVGKVCRHPPSVPAAATSDHTSPGGGGESRLKNPLREICTVGSVREEIPMSHGGLKRARSWKRRTQPKDAFYEKVINVKADVAALLNLFSGVSI